ncbi:glycosyl transferase, group 2 family protein [Nitrospirillum viridazoti Y2]|nr:glycosyl transferase, group 2 family protein [Nitrospirillum amazonense Y2]TWB36416.1 cellulose synthase/poly-beta-1,6-N-acetylglucosamine synthase-like glycosyltransferase [Nitrospirillum amazonense]TWB52256.1 cellulose synthase/poly-beta-1,6-N-acetylglucosamine synthase-like glycosyltransferase [Nitrospirillum amazonense]
MRKILRMQKSAWAVLLLLVLGNIGAWAIVNRPAVERPWAGTIAGVAFVPFQANQTPQNGDSPTADDIKRDLDVVAPHVQSIRTYQVGNGIDQVAPIALERYPNLTITQGAWLSKDPAANEAELAGLVRVARANANVKRVMVGNEVLFRDDFSVAQLIDYIQRVKRQVNVPVSTAEPSYVWLDHPELADACDFITIHLLPYWNKVSVDRAVEDAMAAYRQVQERFPNKHILIGETGWPSDGAYRGAAEAGLVNEAKYIRSFLNIAGQQRLDFYIMEAFDQPWKRTLGGTAETAWGIWDAHRHQKFPMVGGILEVPSWRVLCAIATALAFFPMFFFVLARDDLKWRGQLFYGFLIQTVASVLVWTGTQALTVGMGTLSFTAFMVLILAQLILFAVMLIDGLELTEVVWTQRWKRRYTPVREPLGDYTPKVSIHVPCYNEPAHMVIETLDALAAMDYPNFEVLVIDNNTKDEAVWRPLEEYCAKLGPRFRFFHLPRWPGFKGGALNFGLSVTAPDVEVVGVIDSDYQVTPDWLSATIPYFKRPEVGFVQSPQDYRDWSDDAFKSMINWEYQGFFHIGMIQRNERNAIIQHGTMTLVRKSALDGVGRWAEWCICEDSELGLRLFEEKLEAVYMPDSFGQGLVPDSFAGYKTQRFRWAYGAVQILKRHWREMMPGGTKLTAGQKYHFITGWLPWFADAAHMGFVIGGIVWSLGLLLLPQWIEFPPTVFILPTLSVFFFKVLCGLWLYGERVKCRFIDKLGAAIAGMALTHTVGRAVWVGLFTSGRPFVRTPKCEDQPALIQGFLHAREEVGLMLGLWLAAAAIALLKGSDNRDAYVWATMLVVQSFPYIAALFLSTLNALPKSGGAEATAPAE